MQVTRKSNSNQDLSEEDINPPEDLREKTILIKFGGNAMKNDEIKENVVENICKLKKLGLKVVLVHGGGPAISKMLNMAEIESEFVGGHRKTDDESIGYVEMALKGQVNGEIVRLINSKGQKAVGLSGKDGVSVRALKRYHEREKEGSVEKVDLGQVGDVEIITPDLYHLLIENGYIPVIAPIAYGKDFSDYNVNADMFAGSLAATLKVERFIVLTDVDGLMRDKDDPDTIINEISLKNLKKEMKNIAKGGMIPKVESCIEALEGGAKNAQIVNGSKKDILLTAISQNKVIGTKIRT